MRQPPRETSRGVAGADPTGPERPPPSGRALSEPPEPVDLGEVLGPLLLVADTEALLGSQAEDPDLALVEVLVDVVRRLADAVHRVGLRQRRVDLPLGDQPVGLPRLAVVREVRADDALE